MSTPPAILPKDAAAAEGKVNVQINGKWYRFPKGTRIADACNAVGAHVPCFCYHPKLSIAGSCRMCLVELCGFVTINCFCLEIRRKLCTDRIITKTRNNGITQNTVCRVIKLFKFIWIYERHTLSRR